MVFDWAVESGVQDTSIDAVIFISSVLLAKTAVSLESLFVMFMSMESWVWPLQYTETGSQN